MRRQDAKCVEIVEALIANSAIFEKKTAFSQEKYRLRKQTKYAPIFHVMIFRKFRRSVGESKKLSTSSVKAVYSSGPWSPDMTSCQGIWSIRDDLQVPASPFFRSLCKEDNNNNGTYSSVTAYFLYDFDTLHLIVLIISMSVHFIILPSSFRKDLHPYIFLPITAIAASTLNKNTVLTTPSKAKTSLTTQTFPKCNNMKTSINNLLTKISKRIM
ncbi:tRNA (adenine(58)-N(1))-methyltransferase non-catalytic subunit TRM6 [Dillenia turbinata]|uniref:tRNA (adenine(58)-N(1))-methyltransferase non-catalytic subunit TRM6 n=1 Tax=Dillenia turbinata TaxID=194707 RepID=A0AAN8UNN8_9MAGN